MFRCVFAFAVAIAALCSFGQINSAKADFIVAPTGTVLYDGSNIEDDVTQISGLNLKFFGTSVSSVWVAENGNLNFSADQSFFSDALGTSNVARIAPLWDDFLLLQNQAKTIDNWVLVDSRPGSYLAVTWQNVRLFLETTSGAAFPNTTRSAQVVWFETDQVINGIQYRAGDIAFGYVPHQLGTSNFGANLYATVGIDAGNGTFVALPGTVRGQVTAANSNLLGAQNQLVLFQANSGGGGYSASLQIVAVPEPSSMMFVALGCACLLIRRTRDRQGCI